MNTNTAIDHFSNPPQVGRNIINISDFGPRTTLRRIILSKRQYMNHIGSLPDIHSKKNKSIAQQTKLSKLTEWLLKDICTRSNGGSVIFGINQLELRNKKLPDGSTINEHTLSKVIKNLLHYDIIKKVEDHKMKQYSNMYMIGDYLMELLDPIEIKKSDINRARNKTKELYIQQGINPDKTKICPCCSKELYNTNFGIYEHKEYDSIVELLPVCKSCSNINSQLKKMGKPPLDGWNAAYKVWYQKIKNQTLLLEITPEIVKDQQERILDNEIETLIEKSLNYEKNIVLLTK